MTISPKEWGTSFTVIYHGMSLSVLYLQAVYYNYAGVALTVHVYAPQNLKPI